MSLLNIFKFSDINSGVEEYKARPTALLVDVRTPQEYSQGHIPGSVNIPLDALEGIDNVAADKSVPLFVHCLSGARSSRAAAELSRMGYENVRNIGGINHYRGGLVV